MVQLRGRRRDGVSAINRDKHSRGHKLKFADNDWALHRREVTNCCEVKAAGPAPLRAGYRPIQVFTKQAEATGNLGRSLR